MNHLTTPIHSVHNTTSIHNLLSAHPTRFAFLQAACRKIQNIIMNLIKIILKSFLLKSLLLLGIL